MRRITLLGLCLLAAGCGVFGLSSEERKKLALYQSNAKLYWEGARIDQALDAVRQGLEISPDDYTLNSIAGYCYLRLSDGSPDNLRRAEQQFELVYDQRSPSNHEPFVLLGYGTTQKLLGRDHRRLQKSLEAEADARDLTETERSLRRSRAEEHERRAKAHLIEAERLLNELVAREEMLRQAFKGLMEIRVEREDYAGAVAFGEDFLQRSQDEQEILSAIIRETPSLNYERETRARLLNIVDQDLRVRAALAEMHYRMEEYDACIEQLDQLLLMDQTRSNDYYNRGRALEALGRFEDARRDFDKFLGTTKLPAGDERVAHAFQFAQKR